MSNPLDRALGKTQRLMRKAGRRLRNQNLVVVVGTAHRVGSTWLCGLLADLGKFEPGDGLFPKEHYEFKTGILKLDIPRTLDRLDALRGYYLFKSHSFPVAENTSEIVQYVTIVRDPRDAIVSNSFYLCSISEELGGWDEAYRKLPEVERIKKLVEEGDYIIDRLAAWYRSPIAYKLSYEGLKENPTNEMKKLLDSLGLAVGDETVREVVDRHAFRKKSGRKEGQEDVSSANRKGIVGDWRNKFDASCVELFKTARDGRWNELLVEMGYEKSLDWK